MAQAVRIDSTKSREATDLRRALSMLHESNQLAERLLAWCNLERAGDPDAGNTEIASQMGAQSGTGSTLYTSISNIVTALDGLEDEIARITW